MSFPPLRIGQENYIGGKKKKMITQSAIYWLTRLDAIKVFISNNICNTLFFTAFMLFIVACTLLGFGTLAGNGPYGLFSDKSKEEFKELQTKFQTLAKRLGKWFAIAVAGILVASAINTLLPSSKEMAAIIVIPKIANSESVQSVGDGIVDLAKDWLQELHPKKENSEK